MKASMPFPAVSQLFVEIVQLFDQRREFPANSCQLIFHPRNPLANFRARDQTVVDQLAQTLIKHLGGNTGDESLQLTRPRHSAANGRYHSSRPFAPHHILDAPIGIPFL